MPPAQVTVPAFVSDDHRNLVEPERFITLLVARVRGLPVMVPPDQLNWPTNVTGAVKLIVPELKFTTSFAPGTPAGDQLFVLK